MGEIREAICSKLPRARVHLRGDIPAKQLGAGESSPQPQLVAVHVTSSDHCRSE